MKYVVPTIELANIETKDILASSVEKYEVEKNNDGSGNVIMNALDIFR
ncbi:MAG: hypothetical protein J6A53_01100 [Clostridia bacterium]|nr:hypothetical protein [Clostridia bacterium]